MYFKGFSFLFISQFLNFHDLVSLVICARGLTDRATSSGAVGVGSIPAGRAFIGFESRKSAASPRRGRAPERCGISKTQPFFDERALSVDEIIVTALLR